ncbi:MAG: hypothetical protein HOC91_08650 [Nitrospinaceae bacterium]|jgi:hypothetical protein|nr:hypothetical protein [Nitrospinaceae bacterium]MBT3435211.1 hypothetical protein [Nitrospinaceae bacterium]MBT3822580.1 hypothetical protein [Nitrospinaceae bacterium]MBT4093396.1 hypothetical protein [Nitrospinaceae bacterium]MBT4430567.1 hypothetical protein [Nitrospinaceae bacterium]
MSAYNWKWSLAQLQELSRFDESWCKQGEENTWLDRLSVAAREALHRVIAQDFDCSAPEMEILYSKLEKITQHHYFDNVRREGGNASA